MLLCHDLGLQCDSHTLRYCKTYKQVCQGCVNVGVVVLVCVCASSDAVPDTNLCLFFMTGLQSVWLIPPYAHSLFIANPHSHVLSLF